MINPEACLNSVLRCFVTSKSRTLGLRWVQATRSRCLPPIVGSGAATTTVCAVGDVVTRDGDGSPYGTLRADPSCAVGHIIVGFEHGHVRISMRLEHLKFDYPRIARVTCLARCGISQNCQRIPDRKLYDYQFYIMRAAQPSEPFLNVSPIGVGLTTSVFEDMDERSWFNTPNE